MRETHSFRFFFLVPRFLVTFQISFLTERKAARQAQKRFLLRMHQFMTSQIVFHAETFSALVAKVFFFTRVSRDVTQQLLPPSKPSRTVRARVRKGIRVSFPVDVQGCFRFERFTASRANERSLPRVYPPVIFSRGFQSELSTAYVALVFFYTLVNVFEVIGKSRGMTELFTANVAREIFFRIFQIPRFNFSPFDFVFGYHVIFKLGFFQKVFLAQNAFSAVYSDRVIPNRSITFKLPAFATTQFEFLFFRRRMTLNVFNKFSLVTQLNPIAMFAM